MAVGAPTNVSSAILMEPKIKNRITVVDGFACLEKPGELTVSVDGKTVAQLTAPHIIFATGARARSIRRRWRADFTAISMSRSSKGLTTTP